MTPAARMPHLGATARVPTRRAAELWLLLFAVVVVFAAEAIVESAQGGRLDWHLLAYGAGVPAVAGIVAHLVVRWVAPYADPLLLPCVVALNGLGLVMIHRGDLGVEQQYRDSGVPFPGAVAPTQVLWTACGLLLFLAVLVLVRDHRALAQYAYTLALVGLFLLVLPAVLPASLSEVNGARIWIKLPGFSIQPGEFAKILLTVFAAAYLVAKRDVLSLAGRRVLGLTLPRGRDFGPLLAAWAVCIGMLVRENDLGTS
ncbi:MAG: FtsW/RodA/SpoVE family cell cycle protein, partial [Actinomycetia bacterium]|nr:FtsW/RodA/SpoVE family cell cycle protein [Actinomycetes bacterium]